MVRLSILHPLRRSSCCLISSSCSLFSTQSISNVAENKTKSPHSKLLRVCSSRNANPHFAAIESESEFLHLECTFVSFNPKSCIHHIVCIHTVLRLDWDKAMKKLVADWAKNKRYDEFVELEKNVKSYVDKNIPWLRLETVNYSNESILMQHFPYENIISNFVRYSISAS